MYIDFNQELGGSIQAFYFSGGEPHVKIPEYNAFELDIIARINTWEEFGWLLAYLNAAAHQGKVLGVQVHEFNLYLPYFPGARQDRTDGHSPLTVDLYAKMLFEAVIYNEGLTIYTFDIHSQVGADLISNNMIFGESFNIQVDQLDPTYFDKDITGIIVPDKGAIGRAALFGSTFYPGCDLLQCEKVREFDTGHITSYEVPDDVPDGKYLVVDDICDGGATFNVLADSVRERNKNVELQLYVSHGIFSKGPRALTEKYSKIYTTDSFPHPFYKADFPTIVEMPVPNPFQVKVS